jgi:hypothetical protein
VRIPDARSRLDLEPRIRAHGSASLARSPTTQNSTTQPGCVARDLHADVPARQIGLEAPPARPAAMPAT